MPRSLKIYITGVVALSAIALLAATFYFRQSQVLRSVSAKR